MQTPSTSMLLIICAVIAPAIAFTNSRVVQFAAIAVQLVCIFMIGVNTRANPPKNGPTPPSA